MHCLRRWGSVLKGLALSWGGGVLVVVRVFGLLLQATFPVNFLLIFLRTMVMAITIPIAMSITMQITLTITVTIPITITMTMTTPITITSKRRYCGARDWASNGGVLFLLSFEGCGDFFDEIVDCVWRLFRQANIYTLLHRVPLGFGHYVPKVCSSLTITKIHRRSFCSAVVTV